SCEPLDARRRFQSADCAIGMAKKEHGRVERRDDRCHVLKLALDGVARAVAALAAAAAVNGGNREVRFERWRNRPPARVVGPVPWTRTRCGPLPPCWNAIAVPSALLMLGMLLRGPDSCAHLVAGGRRAWTAPPRRVRHS